MMPEKAESIKLTVIERHALLAAQDAAQRSAAALQEIATAILVNHGYSPAHALMPLDSEMREMRIMSPEEKQRLMERDSNVPDTRADI